MATTGGSHWPPLAAGSRVFLDTNVLVYASVLAAPWHHDAIAAVARLRALGCHAWISRQVLREYLATVTRAQSYAPAAPLATAVANVQSLTASLSVAEDGPRVTAQLLSLLGQVASQGKQIHDANIVATMLVHGVPNLLTHNVKDFTRFAAYINVIPLIPPAPPGVP